MKRLIVAFSSVVFLGALGLWVRNQYVMDEVTWLQRHYRVIGFASWRGDFVFCYAPPVTGIPWIEQYADQHHGIYHSSGTLTISFDPSSVTDYWSGLPSMGGSNPPQWDLRNRNFAGFAFQTLWNCSPTSSNSAIAQGGQKQKAGVLKSIIVLIPAWSVCLLSATLPTLWLFRRLHRHRYAAGLCQKCGYDLRATPDRCPECGSAVPPGASPNPPAKEA